MYASSHIIALPRRLLLILSFFIYGQIRKQLQLLNVSLGFWSLALVALVSRDLAREVGGLAIRGANPLFTGFKPSRGLKPGLDQIATFCCRTSRK